MGLICTMLLHPKMCLFTNRSRYNIHIMDLPLFFRGQGKVLVCDNMIWLLTNFVIIFSCISEVTWIHAVKFLTL